MTYMTVIDQMGREVQSPLHPKRIISLVPSQTELLFYLNVPVVGVTQFCIHPASALVDAQVIGGTKTFDFDQIDALQPDLIIGNKEENYQEGIEKLAETYPVWMSDIATLEDGLAMVRQVGALVGRAQEAKQLANETAIALQQLPRPSKPLKVAYFIWHKPHMVAGSGTFIDALLTQLRWENVFADRERYPSITPADIEAAQPDLLLLSSEPFRYREKHVAQYEEDYGVPALLVDGEAFSWYGPRLLTSMPYLADLVTTVAGRV